MYVKKKTKIKWLSLRSELGLFYFLNPHKPPFFSAGLSSTFCTQFFPKFSASSHYTVLFWILTQVFLCGFPVGSDGKESACNVGDLGSIPGLGRSPGERNSYPLQYSCLGNPTDRGALQATVHGVTKTGTRLRDSLSLFSRYIYEFSLNG